MKLLNQDLKQDKVKAEEEKDRALREARNITYEAENELYRIEKREKFIDNLVDDKANELKKKAEEKLKEKYKKMTIQYGGFFGAVAIYSIIVTFALGYNQIAFRNDFSSFLSKIKDLLVNILQMPLNGGNFASNWTANVFTNDMLYFVVHGLFWLLGFIITVGIVLVISYLVISLIFVVINQQIEVRSKLYLLFNLCFLLLLIMSCESIKVWLDINLMYIFLLGNVLFIVITEFIDYHRI